MNVRDLIRAIADGRRFTIFGQHIAEMRVFDDVTVMVCPGGGAVISPIDAELADDMLREVTHEFN